MWDGNLAESQVGVAAQRGDDGGSTRRSVNLDANANAPITFEVERAILTALRDGANPSSDHARGAAARRILVQARDAVVSLAEGVFEDGVIFTSGCTEANNMVLNSARTMGATLITTVVEHPSVLAPAEALRSEGGCVRSLAVSPDGLIDVRDVERLVSTIDGPIIISVQTANSETGVIQPIADIAALCETRPDTLFHTDAAQAAGKLPIKLDPECGPHAVSISGHKLHGPMGVGALLLADGEARIRPLIRGGEQESGRRAGTEPLSMIAGMGAACALRAANFQSDVERMKALRDRLEHGITKVVPNAKVNGIGAPRLPNTSSIRFSGLDGMALVAALDAEGIMVSQGSACSSMRPTPSHVLTAMGLSEADAFSTVRFSVSRLNSPEEIDAAVGIVAKVCRTLAAFK
ncbi:cysteine desulfurase family protein [Sphingomonas sp.]|jgi:cysteine desulfurase|uniref:cysteine desulfurase family protein n=1 Tax=Sphingomonas sp. TaxID=28214 RepID=UPI002DF36C9D|nr:cysteine desulfurase family protein [Sphingomonas sp.]